MLIGGFQRSSLIDYPGKICAIVFTQGCNFRCPYCFTGNTEILTDRGLFKIREIVEKHIECKVYDYAGNFSPIKEYYERETSSLLEIRHFLHSDAISCTLNHKFFVYNRKANKFIKKEAQYINVKEDYLVIPIPQKEIFSYKLDVSIAIEDLYQELSLRQRFNNFFIDKFIEVTPKFMRLLGYYLSEGCSSKDKGRKNSYYVAFTFNSKEKEYIRDTKEIFSAIFKTELKEVESKKCKTITLISYRGIIGLFFKYYFGEDVYSKKIPTEFIYLDKDLQKQLIIGLFRGDGLMSPDFIKKYKKQRIQITSKLLRYQISLILLRLGIKHSIFGKEIIISDKRIFNLLGQSHLITKKVINTSNRYGFLDDKHLYLKINSVKKINKKTKAIVIINPNNPTGALYPKKIIKEILDVAREHDIIVVSDEIYDEIVFEGSHYSTASLAKDMPIITFNGFSKVYLVPGWRIGYAIFNNPNGELNKIKDAFFRIARARLCANSVAQRAMISALKGSQSHIREMVEKLRKRCIYAYKRINEIFGLETTKPKAAFYIFPKISLNKWKDDKEFVLDVLKETHVLFVHGSGFCPIYGKNHFRAVILPPIETMEEAFNRLERFMKKVRK